MKLKALTLPDVEQVRVWRNEQLEMLRTSFPLTWEQQEDFYRQVVCNRQANARYWGIVKDDNKFINRTRQGQLVPEENTGLIGMVGLENIQFENSLAEISLILNPECSMDTYGEEVLRLLLHEGFMNMGLVNIFTEVCACSPHVDFWLTMAKTYDTCLVCLPERKYYDGGFWDSLYINFNREDYEEHENTILESAQALN